MTVEGDGLPCVLPRGGRLRRRAAQMAQLLADLVASVEQQRVHNRAAAVGVAGGVFEACRDCLNNPARVLDVGGRGFLAIASSGRISATIAGFGDRLFRCRGSVDPLSGVPCCSISRCLRSTTGASMDPSHPGSTALMLMERWMRRGADPNEDRIPPPNSM